MHERPRSGTSLMALMARIETMTPKLHVCLLAALMPFAVCNFLHSTVVPRATTVSAVTQQQQSAQLAPEAADSKAATPAPADDENLSLNDQVIQDVLEPLRTGIETQNIKQVLSIFDKTQLTGFSNMQSQLRAFIRQYAEIHFRYQILQATAEKDHGSATAEIDMDALPYEITQVPARRSVQMRFQLQLEPKGWKVVSFSPSDFFSLNAPGADIR